jgi:hypothetical protein
MGSSMHAESMTAFIRVAEALKGEGASSGRLSHRKIAYLVHRIYCTVRVIVPEAVVAPELPVTVIV